MSTLDKINAELTALENELGQLQKATQEIGEARDAAKTVVSMSLSFMNDFQERITEINRQIDQATKDFKSKVDKSSGDLDNASTQFKEAITESKKALDEISLKLVVAIQTVEDLTKKIEAINILGQFEKIHSSLAALGDVGRTNQQHLLVLSSISFVYFELKYKFIVLSTSS